MCIGSDGRGDGRDGDPSLKTIESAVSQSRPSSLFIWFIHGLNVSGNAGMNNGHAHGGVQKTVHVEERRRGGPGLAGRSLNQVMGRHVSDLPRVGEVESDAGR